MSNSKLVVIFAIAGLVLLAPVIVTVLRSRIHKNQAKPNSLGHRLLSHSRDRNDYRLLVGIPSANPTSWREVSRIDDKSVTLRDSQLLDLSEITTYLVAYPSGKLVEYRCPNSLRIPDWITFPEDSGSPDNDKLTAADLQDGCSLVRVEFGKSTSEPSSKHHYSTTLTNISGNRIRVIKFAGYSKTGNEYSLNTITSQFFTSDDFKEWYGQKSEWIEPGESVTDSNNYGSPPVMWAYYCETNDSRKFVTGGIIE
jgi:hypothetical protein